MTLEDQLEADRRISEPIYQTTIRLGGLLTWDCLVTTGTLALVSDQTRKTAQKILGEALPKWLKLPGGYFIDVITRTSEDLNNGTVVVSAYLAYQDHL